MPELMGALYAPSSESQWYSCDMSLDGEKDLRARTLDMLQKRAAGEDADSGFLDPVAVHETPLSSEKPAPIAHEPTEKMDRHEATAIVLDFAQRMKAGNAHWIDFYSQVIQTQEQRFKDPRTVWGGLYRAIFENARTHPELAYELHELENDIGNNPQMIGPSQHIEVAADMVWDPRLPQPLRDELTRGLGYALRFFDNRSLYQQEIAGRLDFDHPAHFSSTAHFLECLRDVYNSGGEYSDAAREVVGRRLRTSLEQVIEQKKGSYLLQMRARQLADGFNGKDYLWAERDKIPVQLTKGRYGFAKEDGLYLAPSEKAADIERAIQSLRDADEVMRHAVEQGETTFYRSDPRMRAMDKAYEQFNALADHKLGTEDLALPSDQKQNEAEELHDYEYMLSKPIRSIIKEDFGADITHLSLREQFRFLNFLKTVDFKQANNVQEFTKSFGDDGLRTFLVTADDEQLRSNVFEFAESTPKEEARKVFEAYGKLVSGIDSVGDYLREQFGHTGGEATKEVVERMLGRARGLLAHAYEHKDSPDQLADLIDAANTENALFLETFRTLRTEGTLSLEDAKDIDLTIADREHSPLSDVDRLKMESIIRKNYADPSLPLEFRDSVIQGTLDAFDKEDTRWHVLRYRGVPVAYNRFDDMQPAVDGRERRYFGSFNVDPTFGNGRMGDVMIEQTVLQEARDAILEADCNPKTSVSGRYIEVGFIANDLYDLAGVPSFHIVLDTKMNEQSQAKMITEEDLVARTEAGAEQDGVLYRTSDGSSNLDLLKQGYVLTRYLRRGDHFCCAFEKLPNGPAENQA